MRELAWTTHAKFKMKYYGLSESRIKRVLRNPGRIEEGIAEGTIAMMQLGSTTSKKPYEIWVMTSQVKSEKSKGKSEANVRIISAWKYPGRTKPGEPLPQAILREFREAI